jgi:hypothetical protein
VDASFAEAYAKYVEDVYRFILRLVGNVTEAEDLTADTFLRAYFECWGLVNQKLGGPSSGRRLNDDIPPLIPRRHIDRRNENRRVVFFDDERALLRRVY